MALVVSMRGLIRPMTMPPNVPLAARHRRHYVQRICSSAFCTSLSLQHRCGDGDLLIADYDH